MSLTKKLCNLDLFSGIGGFSLAFERAGFQTIAFSETDSYASAVLKKHWPKIPNYGDIKKYKEWPDIFPDVIVGGFPCQPFSVAGKRRGATDDRHLWPSMCGVIARYRPAWVLCENVVGIINLELDTILADLENIGYSTQSFVVPALAVDARHRRDRVWIVPNNNDQRCEEQRGAQPIQAEQHPTELHGEVVSDTEGIRRHTGDTHTRGCAKSRRADKIRERFANGSRWEPEPKMGRVANGISNRSHRIRCLGNAIVPQVAEVFAKIMFQLLKENP